MEFTWDVTKREGVLAEREIDFVIMAFSLFDGRPLYTIPSPRGKEDRFVSIGKIEEKFFAVIWIWREGTIRIITARRARDGEEKQYKALYG